MTNNLETLSDLEYEIMDDEDALEKDIDAFVKMLANIQRGLCNVKADYKKLAEFYKSNQK